MKSVYVLLLVLSLAVICMPSQAATVVKLTFDHGVMAPGPADYTAAANEILPTGVHGSLLNWGYFPDISRATGNLLDSDGPQGGQVLNMNMSGAWGNKQGYYFGRDSQANGDNYFMGQTYPAYTAAMQIGSPMPEINGAYTIEALVKPSFEPNNAGLTGISMIYDAQRLDTYVGGTSIYINQNTGMLKAGPLWEGPSNLAGPVIQGNWYHIGLSVTAGGHQDLYLNGALVGSAEGANPWLPGTAFTIGTAYWPAAGWNFQGQIDGFAISDVALAPGSFVLPNVPEPASIVTLAIGMLGVCGSIRRRARK